MKLYLVAILFRLTLYQAVSQGLIVYDCNYDETGRPLPPGVPKDVDTNGATVYIPSDFTTKAYQQAALDKVIQEANLVAKELKLPEMLPITRSNLANCYINTFDYAYSRRAIGFVETTNFCYYASRGNKFNQLVALPYEQICSALRNRGRSPLSQLDTNAAYQLATQWLAAASIDVAGLNRDCLLHISVDWADYHGDMPKEDFVPVYDVWWSLPHGASVYNVPASVELYLPENKLLQMKVEDPKYILRSPVVFTNLAELFPGKAPIHTNYPVPVIYMPSPPPN